MSRSALTLSLVVHAGVLAAIGWSYQSVASHADSSHAGPGPSGIGVSVLIEGPGGLLIQVDEPPSAPAPLNLSASTADVEFKPPEPTIEVHVPPVAAVETTPPVVTTVTGIPREIPTLAPPKKARNGARAARTASTSATANPGDAGRGENGGGSTGSGSGGGSSLGGGGGGPGYVPPQFLMRYKPPYPEQARAQKLEGVVLLLVAVDAAGHVTSAQLSRGCGHDILDRAALSAVRSWRFTPARQADHPISATVEIPIRFHFST